MKRSLRIIGSISLLGCVTCSAIMYRLLGQGDRDLIRYYLWKRGLVAYSEPAIAAGFFHDFDGKNSEVVGLTKEQIRNKFPNLRDKNNSTTEQSWYNEHHLKEQDILWIGDTSWAIEFRDGKAVSVELFKG